MSLKAIIDTLKRYNKFLITSHINPEADALGSELALYELIKALNKEAICVNSEKIPAHYEFLPGAEHIEQPLKKAYSFEAAIVLDCPTIDRIGKVKRILRKTKTIVNIDHHISNTNFGSVNWVDPKASSTGEMIYALYKKLSISISKKTALYIYISILTDTGSFNYSNTSKITHEITSDLLGYGLHPQDIYRYLYENKTLQEIRLLGKTLSDLKIENKGKIAYMVCTKNVLKRTGSISCNTENFINFARSIKGVKIAIFIREDLKKRNLYNVSFRSNGDTDVNEVAHAFGGGGHKNASGCVIKGTLREVKRRVLAKAKESLST